VKRIQFPLPPRKTYLGSRGTEILGRNLSSVLLSLEIESHQLTQLHHTSLLLLLGLDLLPEVHVAATIVVVVAVVDTSSRAAIVEAHGGRQLVCTVSKCQDRLLLLRHLLLRWMEERLSIDLLLLLWQLILSQHGLLLAQAQLLLEQEFHGRIQLLVLQEKVGRRIGLFDRGLRIQSGERNR